MEGNSCKLSEPVFSVAEDRGARPEEGSWEANTVSSKGGDPVALEGGQEAAW